jgi:ELWxxDGT repeat protein
VKDIYSGNSSSVPTFLTVFEGKIYFRAEDAATGVELWRSDGTAGGTVRVKDISPGTASSAPLGLTVIGSTLFFSANDGSTGVELWKSDGTSGGTVRVKDIRSGSSSSSPDELTTVGSTLFFAADDGSTGRELWASDGSSPGTSRVMDIDPGSSSSSPSELTAIGNTLYFTADDGLIGRELWTSDGTAAGTVETADLNLGEESSDPDGITQNAMLVLFAAQDGIVGRELWAHDTSGGVVVLTLVKTFGQEYVARGSSDHTFTLTVTNSGGLEAVDVVVSDTVDADLDVTAVDCGGGSNESSGNLVECVYGALAGFGGSATATVTYDVRSSASSPQSLLNVAAVDDDSGQHAEGSDTVEVVEACDLAGSLELFGRVVDSTEVHEACQSISAGPDFRVVGPDGDLTFRAGVMIILQDGFSVEAGAVFAAEIDPSLNVD